MAAWVNDLELIWGSKIPKVCFNFGADDFTFTVGQLKAALIHVYEREYSPEERKWTVMLRSAQVADKCQKIFRNFQQKVAEAIRARCGQGSLFEERFKLDEKWAWLKEWTDGAAIEPEERKGHIGGVPLKEAVERAVKRQQTSGFSR